MRNKKKVLIAFVLVLILSVCCALFAGCSIVDPDTWDDDFDSGSESGGSGSGSGSGTQTAEIVPNKFKMGYRGTAQGTNVAANIKTLAETLVGDFASTFGAGKGYTNGKEGDEKIDYTNVYYYDSIRYQAYLKYDEEDDETYIKAYVENAWNWSFDNQQTKPLFKGAADGREVTSYEGNAASHYNVEKTVQYADFYTTLYSEAMEVVLYEILLGKTDYQNMIVVGDSFDSNGYPQVTYRGQSVSVVDGKLDFSSFLTTLKAEYFDKATYFGFSVSDGTKIKNYIINYVIGESAHKDKDGADQLDDNRHYNDYVQALVDGLINSETEYYWYARTGFKDGRLAISSTGDYFQLVPKAEYQSLVLMAEEEDEFTSCTIALWSDVSFSGQVALRYFDGNTTSILCTKQFSVKANGKDTDCIITLTPDNQRIDVDAFNNYDEISATTEKVNGETSPVYIPMILSNTSTGVFNEALSDGAFVELIFAIDTTKINNYSGFKVVFTQLQLLSQNQFDE